MKALFKISLVVFITLQVSTAQEKPKVEMDEKHTIYKENFSTNANTTLVLNLNNTTAKVIESPDEKVYIEYTIEFKNVRKKIKERQLKHLLVSGKKEDNKITYSTKSKSNFSPSVYNHQQSLIDRFDKKKFLKDSLPKPVIRKSLDSILHEIKYSESIYRNKIREALNIKPSQAERWNKSTNNLIISKMVIKIPKNIHVRATIENSNLVFMDDFYNRATMNIRNSKLRFKALGNTLSIIDFDNGYFNAETVTSGSYSFANLKEVRIGSLSNSLLNTEFTKIEIGEIGKGNKITDFNSEYYFYNWTEDFQRFDLFSEYSKIHFFYPDLNHNLEVIGYNTRNIVGKDAFEVTMQPKSRERNRLMSKPANPNEKSSGLIFFDIINGIIYSHNDTIKTINKN